MAFALGPRAAQAGYRLAGYDCIGSTNTEALQRSRAVSLGAGDEEPLLIEDLGAEVGGLVAMYFQHGTEEGLEIQVPVLDGRLPEYEDLVP